MKRVLLLLIVVASVYAGSKEESSVKRVDSVSKHRDCKEEVASLARQVRELKRSLSSKALEEKRMTHYDVRGGI